MTSMPPENIYVHTSKGVHALRPFLAALLALVAVLAVLFATLWWRSGGPVSEYEEKIQILASLQDETDPSISEEERLDILRRISSVEEETQE